MESIDIAGFDAGVDTWSSGGKHMLRAQRVAVCCGGGGRRSGIRKVVGDRGTL